MRPIVDGANKLVEAVIPVKITIDDSRKKQYEFSGYYGAKAGKVVILLDIAKNDPRGKWKVTAMELALGLKAMVDFSVK